MNSKLTMTWSSINRNRHDVAIVTMLSAGWTFPSVWPPGLVFGSTGLPTGELYLNYLYVGLAGFFSKSLIVEESWEWTHGHTWPVGPWIMGYLGSLTVPVAAGLIIWCPAGKAMVVILWGLLSFWLVGTWMECFTSISQLSWRSGVLGVLICSYGLFLLRPWSSSTPRQITQNLFMSINRSLLIYPLWVLVLCLFQGRYPFVGWAFTFAGCILLALRPFEGDPRKQSQVAQPTPA